MSIYSNWLKEKLKEKGMTQIELAQRTNTEKSLVNRWIKGNMSPRWDKVETVAKALGCRIEFIPEEKERSYEAAYDDGFKNGYLTAIGKMVKVLKGMETYGGNKQEKRADGVPEHHAGRAADRQQAL